MKFDDYINDCISVGPSLKLARVTLIGPYPTSDFVRAVIAREPKEIVLAVDDGWPQEYLEDIALACQESETRLTLHRVAPLTGNGLVHAKLYLLEWQSENANYRRHFLLAGSPNASLQGFGGHAETFVHLDLADLDPREKRATLQYFAALADGRAPSSHWLHLRGSSYMLLPHLRIVCDALPNGFDAWLRRGRLCHKYQPDPSFGRLVLRLKKPIPQDQLGSSLDRSGFSVIGETKTFARPYVRYEASEDDGSPQAWRGRYFTETDYGHWTSRECFVDLESTFVAPKLAGRKQALTTIQKADAEQEETWIAEFLRSIETVFDAVDNATRADYFHTRYGSLDLAIYRRQAQEKLGKDRGKARDAYFAQRFISGYSFPKVPPLGHEFDEFALTLCANALVKMRGTRVLNRFANRLRTMGMANAGMAPEDLLKALRKYWNERKPDIADFHRSIR